MSDTLSAHTAFHCAGLVGPLALIPPAVLSVVLLAGLLAAVGVILYQRRRSAALGKQLSDAEERFQSLVETSNDWIWEVDADLVCTYTSPQIQTILGYRPVEVIGRKCVEFIPPQDAERVRAVVADAARKKIPFWNLENQSITRDGRIVYLESNGVPLLDDEGRLRGYRGVNRDITERRLAENASEEYRRRMEGLIGNLFGVAYRCRNTPEWPMEFISRGCLELTGYSPVDFVSGGVLLKDLILPEDRQRVWQQVQQDLAQRQPFNLEYRLVDRCGQTHWVVERGSGIWNDDRLEALEGLIVDITDHKTAQQQLQQSREFLESVIRSVPTGISVTVDRVFVNVNDRFCQMFGYGREELIGRSTRIMHLSDESYERLETILYEPMRRGGSATEEVTFVRKDGSLIEIFMSGAPIDPNDWSKGITFSLLDITERNKTEQARETLMRQLRAKNEELESLVYIASHDLRSPLVNIRGFSGELEKCLAELRGFMAGQPLDAPARQHLEDVFKTDLPECLSFINSGTAKMETMLDGILRLSRVGSAQMRRQRLNVGKLLEQIVRQFQFTLTSTNGSIHVSRELPDCMGDALLVGQLFSNLIDNAVKYRSNERPSSIRIEGETTDGHAAYRIIDNGIGIAPEHIHKVFDIFHQLNPGANSGQGLGLTIVRKIIERQDGRVWLESVCGQGTTVHVHLPRP